MLWRSPAETVYVPALPTSTVPVADAKLPHDALRIVSGARGRVSQPRAAPLMLPAANPPVPPAAARDAPAMATNTHVTKAVSRHILRGESTEMPR